MAEKMKPCQNKSTNISIDHEIQNILVKNSEKDIDIDFVQELSADKSVKSNPIMRWKQIYKLLLQTSLILKYMYWKYFNLTTYKIQNTCVT